MDLESAKRIAGTRWWRGWFAPPPPAAESDGVSRDEERETGRQTCGSRPSVVEKERGESEMGWAGVRKRK